MGPEDDAMVQAWREQNHAPAPAAAPAAPAPQSNAGDYADAWNKHDTYLDDLTQKWGEFKKDHPVAGFIAGVAPYTGTATSALETRDALNQGNNTGAAIAATGMIPGVKLIKEGGKAILAGEAMQRAARNTLIGADAYSAAKKAGQAMKTTGAVKAGTGAAAASAGPASRLADYIHSWNTDAH